MRNKKLTLTTRYVLLVGIMLFVANTVLGFVILDQSKAAMRSLINKDMLDVVKSAAGSLDGDVLGAITADDEDTPAWLDIEDRLLVFQESVDIEFIYAVKQVSPRRFVFTVDPDPVEPGAYGEEIITTPALERAATGVPTVDEDPAADRWGNFYSAYCPVFDKDGEVAGIVGVDFNAAWYDAEVQKYTVSIAAVTVMTVLMGVIVMGLVVGRVRKRFKELDAGLSALSDDVDLLVEQMAAYSGEGAADGAAVVGAGDAAVAEVATVDPEPGHADELEVLANKIGSMQNEMRLYLQYLREQAYTDSLTRVANSTAYHEKVAEIEQQIAEGTADFWAVVLDLNSLKYLNDTFGHECGDYYIRGAAHSLAKGFAGMPVYRIGGDEFAVIVEGADEAFVEQGLRGMAEAVEAFNAATEYPARLSVAHGTARFNPDEDMQYTQVFARADKVMYANKAAYYESLR